MYELDNVFRYQDCFNIMMLFQDDDTADQGVISANTSNLDGFYPAEEDTKQNANNTRGNTNKTQKDAGVNEKARYVKLLAFGS